MKKNYSFFKVLLLLVFCFHFSTSWGQTKSISRSEVNTSKIVLREKAVSVNSNRNGNSILGTSINTTTATACDSYTWAQNGQTYTTSGLYNAPDGVTQSFNALSAWQNSVTGEGASITSDPLSGYSTSSPIIVTLGGVTATMNAPTGMYSSGTFIGTNNPNEVLTITFSTPVYAAAANYYVTNISDVVISGDVTATYKDASNNVIFTDTRSVSTNTELFGYSSTTPISSIELSVAATTPVVNRYISLSNFNIAVNPTALLNLTINVTPVADAPANVTACDSYTLPALAVGNYFTQPNGGGTQLNAGATITSTQTLYVFAETGTTPNCTNENSFSITINSSSTIPTFNQSGPYCSGVAIPALPTTSNNGIVGTWSPALNNTTTTTYTFTPNSGQCSTATATMTIVINALPDATITGGGVTVCQGAPLTLSAPSGAATYLWQKRYLAGATPTTVGNAQTLDVTQSGVYTVTVTSASGCTATATTIVNVADYVFSGSLSPSDTQQTGRLNRFAVIPTCASPKVCPGTFTTAGSRAYDSYSISNPSSSDVCATIGLNSGCGTAAFSAAYLNTYNPTSLCTNYIADPGSSPATSIFYEATIPAGQTLIIIVHEVNPGQSCANYTLTVNVPRPNPVITPSVPNPGCGQAVTLTAPLSSSYLWSPGGETTQSINITAAANSNYSVQLGYGNTGCVGTASLNIGNLVTPIFDPIAPICAGDALAPLPTTSNNGITGTWSPALNNTQTTTYTFTPSGGQCTTTLTITVNSTPPPAINADLEVTMTSQCAFLSGTYSNIGMLNGKGNFVYNNDNTIKIGYDGSKWVLYAFDNLANQGFENPNQGDFFPPTSGWIPTQCNNGEMSITLPASATFCEGTVADLSATGTNLQWYTTETGGTALSETTSLLTGTYYVSQTINGCESPRTPLNVINNTPTPPNFTQVAPICVGGTIAALPNTSDDGITGTWSPAIDATTTTTYTFTPDAGQCAIPTTMTIVVNPLPAVAFTANPFPICQGSSTVLSANVTNATPTVSTGSLTFNMNTAAFGVPLTTPLTGILANAPSNGCTAFTPGLFSGKIALIQRGTCAFTVKAKNAQDAGAIGVILYNNVAGAIIPAGVDPTITIPVYSVTLADGQALIAAMTANEVTVTLNPAPPLTYLWGNGDTTQTTNTGVLNVDTDFTVTVTNTITGCSNTVTVTVPVTPNVVPVFDPVAPICSGSTLASLPTTSNNGVAGTWSPALDNTTTTTYTFTPTPVAGQCLASTTLTITVNPIPSVTGDANQTVLVDNPNDATIEDLIVTPVNVVWYPTLTDAQAGTNAIPAGTVITTGSTYYAVDQSGPCPSEPFAVTVTVTLANEEFNDMNFTFAPNPTSGILNISFSENITEVKVINLLGQTLIVQKTNANEVQVDLAALPQETYLVTVTANDKQKTVKIIKK